MMRTPRLPVLAAVLAASAALAAACSQQSRLPPPQVPEGNPKAGAHAISVYGCGSCHHIPGVNDANGLVGPPLDHFSRRSFIAGELTNSGPNLQRWIEDPQAVEPGTAMPNLGVTPTDARDIAAYLFTLR